MKKTEDDFVTLDEFSTFLQKRRLDLNFSGLDQRLMFEKFDKSFHNKIKVSEVLNYIGDEESTAKSYRDSGEVKTHIVDLLEKRRIQSKMNLETSEIQKQLRSAFRNLDPDSTGYISKDTLRWALGPEYLALEISPEEASNAIEEISQTYKKKKGGVKGLNSEDSVSYDAFVHYLDICNVDPNYHPFYDQRAAQFSYMQRKITALSSGLQDEERLGKLKEVADRYASTNKRDHIPKTMGLSKSAPLLTHSNNGSIEIPSYTDAEPSSMTPIQTQRSELLLQDPQGVARESFQSPKPALKGKQKDTSGKMFKNDLDNSHFSQQSSLSRMDDTMLTHARTRYETENRRIMHQKGLWSGTGAMDSSSPLYIDDQDRFRSMNAEYFPKLVYEPSKPVRRDRVGDADRAYLENEVKHEKRVQRIRANMQVTKDRLDYESFVSQLRDDERDKRKARDMLAYEQTVLVKDMNKHSKRAIEVMQRKSRKELSNQMWGGHRVVGDYRAPDDRDFGTTYLVGYGGSLYNGDR